MASPDTISLTIEAEDDASAKVAHIRKSISELNGSFGGMGESAKHAGRRVGELNSHLEHIEHVTTREARHMTRLAGTMLMLSLSAEERLPHLLNPS